MRRLAVVLLLALVAPTVARADSKTEAAGLRFSAPSGWKQVRPGSPVRAAQFRIPHVRGDKEDGEAILFQSAEHATQTNTSDAVERWYAQIVPADGRASKDAAVVGTRTVRGLTVRTYDLSGTYRAPMGPMAHDSKPDYRLLGAVVEGTGGPWYWRAVGPAKTMEKAKPAFDELLESLDAVR
jgi:hypothetical protein